MSAQVSKISSKVELNKNGRPVNWHGKCWAYYKNMMELSFADKSVLEYANGDKTLSSGASDAEKKTFNDAQTKVKHLIMSSLSMELGQQVMTKSTGTEMRKYLEDMYEGKTNTATRTNQEIILFNKLQAAKCKPNWDVRQHVNNMFLLKAQLAALNADVRAPIFINMLMRSLSANPRFDRLRGLVEIGASEVDTPDKLKDQILRMDSYNKCDRELGVISAASAQSPPQNQPQKQKPPLHHAGSQGSGKQSTPEKAAVIAATKLDKQQGTCFNCHKPGHMEKDCFKKGSEPSATPAKRQATYTRRRQPTSGDAVNEKKPANPNPATRGNLPTMPCGEDFSVNARPSTSSEDYAVWEWCFDNAANVPMASDRRYFIDYHQFNSDAECVRGFRKNFAATPVGHGTVQVVVKRGDLDVVLTLRDVFYDPDSKNLLSHWQAEDQGYAIEYHGRSGTRVYELWKGEEKLLEVGHDQYGLFTFTAHNAFLSNDAQGELPPEQPDSLPSPPRANISAADGAADLQRWHERLGHLCPQFVKIMVDRELVTGMMLRQRVFQDCESCHMGKERNPSARQKLELEINRKNQVIFTDLLFPKKSPVLVVQDGYSRYTTIYPLKTKGAPEVNASMRRYIEWADRQFPGYKVAKVVTDGGPEFVNEAMKEWYRDKGIEFKPNPPHSSHLNPCERVHQTLVHTLKTMLIAAGLPKTFWLNALEMAVFLRNRSHHHATKETPYYLMMGKKPDLHRIKMFGSICYVHKPTGPSRRKLDENCRLGFLVGYLEGQAGCRVYFPSERVVQHVEHAAINEDILYKDRYGDGYTTSVAEWMSNAEDDEDSEYDGRKRT